jgi:hypothetical protein
VVDSDKGEYKDLPGPVGLVLELTGELQVVELVGVDSELVGELEVGELVGVVLDFIGEFEAVEPVGVVLELLEELQGEPKGLVKLLLEADREFQVIGSAKFVWLVPEPVGDVQVEVMLEKLWVEVVPELHSPFPHPQPVQLVLEVVTGNTEVLGAVSGGVESQESAAPLVAAEEPGSPPQPFSAAESGEGDHIHVPVLV